MKTTTPQKYTIVEHQISTLVKAEYNPRRLTAPQAAALTESMRQFGFVQPAIINVNPSRKNIIIGGHQRISTWQNLGHDSCPCIELTLSVEQERELNIRLNKNTGEFDFHLLDKFFSDDDLMRFGFMHSELLNGKKDLGQITNENDSFSLPEMEIRLYEHHDYIVFVFENMHDFLNAVNAFNIKKCNASFSEKSKKIGIGRVINGKKLVKLIAAKDVKK